MSLKSVIKKVIPFPRSFPRIFLHPFKHSRMFRDMSRYNKMNTRPEFHASITKIYPCIKDWDSNAGSLGVYFWQDLRAARKIFQRKPSAHYDIGSRVDGFIAHVLSFMPVTMIDIRQLQQKVEDFAMINGSDYTEHLSFDDFHAMRTGKNYSGCVVGLFDFVRE